RRRRGTADTSKRIGFQARCQASRSRRASSAEPAWPTLRCGVNPAAKRDRSSHPGQAACRAACRRARASVGWVVSQRVALPDECRKKRNSASVTVRGDLGARTVESGNGLAEPPGRVEGVEQVYVRRSVEQLRNRARVLQQQLRPAVEVRQRGG